MACRLLAQDKSANPNLPFAPFGMEHPERCLPPSEQAVTTLGRALQHTRRGPRAPCSVRADLLLDLLDAALQAEDLLLQARLLALERGDLLLQPACAMLSGALRNAWGVL